MMTWVGSIIKFFSNSNFSDEQWKMVYGELETFIRSNLHSDLHRKVLECLMASRSSEKTAQISDPRLQDTGTNGDKTGKVGKDILDSVGDKQYGFTIYSKLPPHFLNCILASNILEFQYYVIHAQESNCHRFPHVTPSQRLRRGHGSFWD